MKITAGTPATIIYLYDTRAAVVTRATEKRVWVARVATTNIRHEREIPEGSGELPVVLEDGVLDQPVGDGLMYTLYTDRDGNPYGARGGRYSSDRVRFGHSTSRTDYKY